MGTGDHDDDVTPQDIGTRGPASTERKALGTLYLHMLKATEDLLQACRRWDSATPLERKVLAGLVADEAREFGDAGHDLARLMGEIALAAAEPA
jgi:hypothetical protein